MTHAERRCELLALKRKYEVDLVRTKLVYPVANLLVTQHLERRHTYENGPSSAFGLHHMSWSRLPRTHSFKIRTTPAVSVSSSDTS